VVGCYVTVLTWLR